MIKVVAYGGEARAREERKYERNGLKAQATRWKEKYDRILAEYNRAVRVCKNPPKAYTDFVSYFNPYGYYHYLPKEIFRKTSSQTHETFCKSIHDHARIAYYN